MKRYNLLSILCACFFAVPLVSCENQDVTYPDYGTKSVYFAYQFPVRTIVLGEDIFDNSLDNEGKFEIYATMGGVYSNSKKIDIDFEVDNSLTDNLYIVEGRDTTEVKPMPSTYYTLSSETITLNKSLQGAVGVQLSDAFFADADALRKTYVVPLRMTNVTNADTILSGVPKIGTPSPSNSDLWEVLPKDFVLYCVKYINPWHANYLRRGRDEITKNGVNSTVTRSEDYVENDQVIKLTTLSLNEVEFPTDHKSQDGVDLKLKLKFSFNESQNVAVTAINSGYVVNDSITISNIVATGNGSFVTKGEKMSWGNKDRDALYLDYEVSYEVETQYPNAGFPTAVEEVTYKTTDTFVVRDRGSKVEVFSPMYKE